MTFLMMVGSERVKQITREDMITAKFAAKACDLVYKTIDKKQARPMKASHVANMSEKRTHVGLMQNTSNLNRFPIKIISPQMNVDTIEAEIIQEAQ